VKAKLQKNGISSINWFPRINLYRILALQETVYKYDESAVSWGVSAGYIGAVFSAESVMNGEKFSLRLD
jgi:hypothetical protein